MRIRQAETMEAILQRQNFMIGILRNANAAPITDIIVRILDNPETVSIRSQAFLVLTLWKICSDTPLFSSGTTFQHDC